MNELYALIFDKCTVCYKTLETREVIKSIDELIICEMEVYCIHCGAIQNYYSAGHYEREKWLKEAIEKDPEQAAALLAVRRLTDHNSL